MVDLGAGNFRQDSVLAHSTAIHEMIDILAILVMETDRSCHERMNDDGLFGHALALGE